MSSPEPQGLRERTRIAVRREISQAAMALFVEQGFENTSVEQISARAGISSRSFFRYFGTKEEVVLGNLADAGERLRVALEKRPADETPWEALRAAFDVLIARSGDAEGVANVRRIPRMLVETPALRARHLEKQLQWQQLLVPDIQRRLGPQGRQPDVRANSLVAAALSCLDAAVAAWAVSETEVPVGQILDEAIAAVRTA